MDSNETNKLSEEAITQLPNDAELEKTLTETTEEVETTTEIIETELTENDAVPAESDRFVSSPTTKDEILAALKSLTSENSEVKEKVDGLKQAFYKLLKQEQEQARKVWAEEGNAPEDFVVAEDALEIEFKTTLNSLKEKRAEQHAEQEKQKQVNLQRKLDIIENIRQLTESAEDIGRNYHDFRKLQQAWKETGSVPQEQINELWKNYQMQVERFYDLLKINNEFREYDFKKNLEIKTVLCESAERLTEETDVVVAFRQLQKLHEEWRDTGPVAKEFREEIWNRFKQASGIINKNHQGFFENLKTVETKNLELKSELCEQMDAIDFSQLKTYKDWDAKTAEIIALQEKWKTIGFAPKKANIKIFERFRASCDNFFKLKSDFYKSSKETLNQNLEKKKALCEKAESLKDSTDWKTTADLLIQLQKEWKTIGPVPKKFSDIIWKRFIAACDYFFEQKEKNAPSQKSEEQKNLALKKELIAKIEAIDDSTPQDEAGKLLQELTREWNNIGHVPFKEKDTIYKAWHTAVDNLVDKLKIEKGGRRNQRGSEERPQGKVLHERERLLRQFDSLTNEIKTSENNIGFFTTSKSSGNGLLDQMKQKIEDLKTERDVVYKKIKDIDDTL
jgi:hypothetical protein